MKKRTLTTAIAVTFTSISAAVVAPLATAQTSALEEIVVTARKRQESMQDVGLAISALILVATKRHAKAQLLHRVDECRRRIGVVVPVSFCRQLGKPKIQLVRSNQSFPD